MFLKGKFVYHVFFSLSIICCVFLRFVCCFFVLFVGLFLLFLYFLGKSRAALLGLVSFVWCVFFFLGGGCCLFV